MNPMGAAPMGSALSEYEASLQSVTDICELINSLNISDEHKLNGYNKLATEVKKDTALTPSERDQIVRFINDYIVSHLTAVSNESQLPDTFYDPEGILDDEKKTFTAKPMMVTPDAVLRFNAMATLNMYQYMGMPCLVCVSYGFGLCTYTSDISYELIMHLAQVDYIDKIYFTDGKGVAIVKKEKERKHCFLFFFCKLL